MRRLAVITALIGATTLISAAPAAGQSLTPGSAVFPPTPARTDSAPIRFTLTAGLAPLAPSIGIGTQTQSSGTFKPTNTCPQHGLELAPMQSCFIDVVFTPFAPTPVHKSNVLFAGGMTRPLSGTVRTSGGGGKKKCKKKGGKKKGKKRAAAGKKKCKKK